MNKPRPDNAVIRAERAEAERDRYRDALTRIYQSGRGRHVEVARAALDGEDEA